MQSAHKLVTGENGWARSKSFHLTSHSIPSSLSSHSFWLREVSVQYFLCLNDFLWFPRRSLNVVDVSPIYVCVWSIVWVVEGGSRGVGMIVAWYTSLSVRHFPSSGQFSFFLQLHVLTAGGASEFLITFELCEEIILLIFGVVL